ncbi:MAG: hypothetical protein ACKOAY_11835 [Haliscomenobacter sp.]
MGVHQFLHLPGQHSIFYYALLALLGLVALQAVITGFLYFLKKSGEKRANALYAFLLFSMGGTLIHYLLQITGADQFFPQLAFLPVYATLSFPPLLFYHIKISVYPAYRFRATDIKHLLLPGGQLIYFWIIFLSPLTFKMLLGRQFYNPFYGAMETALYLATSFAYMYFGYRYVLQKRRQLRTSREVQLVRYLSRFVQVLSLLFAIHALFVLTDFISFEFLHINLRTIKPYAALGILSFAAVVSWLNIYGAQVLIWGRKVLR